MMGKLAFFRTKNSKILSMSCSVLTCIPCQALAYVHFAGTEEKYFSSVGRWSSWKQNTAVLRTYELFILTKTIFLQHEQIKSFQPCPTLFSLAINAKKIWNRSCYEKTCTVRRSRKRTVRSSSPKYYFIFTVSMQSIFSHLAYQWLKITIQKSVEGNS